MSDFGQLRRNVARLEADLEAAREQLDRAIEDAQRYAYEEKLKAMTPAQRAAHDLIEKACADPKIWAVAGMPGEYKLNWLEREIAAAIEKVVKDTK